LEGDYFAWHNAASRLKGF
jgi:hypothetical protein